MPNKQVKLVPTGELHGKLNLAANAGQNQQTKHE